jgi:hypothetical protein
VVSEFAGRASDHAVAIGDSSRRPFVELADRLLNPRLALRTVLGEKLRVSNRHVRGSHGGDSWTFESTDSRLRTMMKKIHQSCYETEEEYGSPGNYIVGANIHGFLKVARAMAAMGLI